MKFKMLALPVLLLLCSGCGSLLVQHNSKSGTYPGARLDAYLIAHPSSLEHINLGGNHGATPPEEQAPGSFSPVPLFLGLIDFPLSAALDTLLLPADLWYRDDD
jgi:uncharacterized protein YceK